MKKVVLILFASMLFVLGACSSNDDQDQSSNGTDNNASTEESPVETSDDATKEDEKSTEDDVETEDQADDNSENEATDDSEDGTESSNNELADFPEYETLVDEIDVDTLEAKIETDNPNKRVILYADDSGKNQYKSIFIKKQNRLKIIQFDDNGQVFNEVI